MQLFLGNDPEGQAAELEDEVEWVEADKDADRDNMWVEGEGSGADVSYTMLTQAFGWTNIDRWYSDPRPKTTIHVSVPEGWDDANSAVYLSYDGEPTALAQFDTYDDETGLFSEHYGLIPIGLEVHIVFVTELEGQWSYAIQAATIEDAHLTTFDAPEDLIETDLAGLTEAINALP